MLTLNVFSIVRKIVTDYHSQMEQNTLCALVSCKLNNDAKCYELETPNELLSRACTATMDYNKAHSSKVKNELCNILFLFFFCIHIFIAILIKIVV